MINKVLALIAYCLRWLGWAVHYLVIWPAGTLVLIISLMFCLDNTTPGAVAVDYLQNARNITDGQHWTWRECPKQPSSEFPHGIQQDACPEVVSDAQGYAAYVDRILQGTLTSLWILMGLIYTGLAWLLGIRPSLPRNVFAKVVNDKRDIRSASSCSDKREK